MLRLAFAALLTVALLAAAPAASAPPRAEKAAPENACTRGACAIRRARRMLADRMFTRFVDTGSELVPSSLDQRLHLCRSRRFVYDSVSNVPDAGPPTVQRLEGTWRVTSARFGPGSRARARVRGTPDDGSTPLTVTITRVGSVVRVDGLLVFVARSDLC